MRRPVRPAGVATSATTATTAAAGAAAALLLLTGCSGGNLSAPAAPPAAATPVATSTAVGTPTARPEVDPAAAVARAGKEPYAVSVRSTIEIDGEVFMDITSRQNHNTLYTGRQERHIGGRTTEIVVTADAEYHRVGGPSGTWTRSSLRFNDTAEYDLAGYAPVLLSLGPEARKGVETRDGVLVHHLGGHLDLDRLGQVSARARSDAESEGATGIDLDQWIDVDGRTRYAEKRWTEGGTTALVTMAFSDYGPPEVFDSPIVNGA
ncbi:hypothetical protein ADK60_23965 [Streptomyces sp. XY431]|uniref:hypothetical protein n=1 Tax=Streptomyces sp. XY431 TaxID=1415562 RepID=UPI0006AE7DEA|nr:hypothetical protein [Streptomyces sp. XY431]KOV23503.1 hypothetical protein ADK60_23965 [Streptomyces sp. XY431]